MNRREQLLQLNKLLLEDMEEYRHHAGTFPKNEDTQWRLFRSLVNIRQPGRISKEFLTAQDAFLQSEKAARGVADWKDLQPREPGIYL